MSDKDRAIRAKGNLALGETQDPGRVGGLTPHAARLTPGWVADLPEYRLDLAPCRHKLDQNEMPWELPRRVKEEVAVAMATSAWRRYPDFHAERLREALAARLDWPAAGILAGNGSNELLALVLRAFARPGGEVVSLLPGFGLYPTMVTVAGSRPRALGPRRDLRLPLDELAAEVAADPRRPVLLCSPNNPTGEAVAPERVAALAAALEAPLLLDEAYGDFSDHDYRPLLERYPNLVLFRTFSKAWSLAALRVGYLLARPELVAGLVKVKLPYNLNPTSAAAAVAALSCREVVARRVELVRRRRSGWEAMLRRHGFEVFPSQANFLLMRAGTGEAGKRRAMAVAAGLAGRGIRVRDVGSAEGLTGCLRITVGSGAALRAVDRSLTEVEP